MLLGIRRKRRVLTHSRHIQLTRFSAAAAAATRAYAQKKVFGCYLFSILQQSDLIRIEAKVSVRGQRHLPVANVSNGFGDVSIAVLYVGLGLGF